MDPFANYKTEEKEPRSAPTERENPASFSTSHSGDIKAAKTFQILGKLLSAMGKKTALINIPRLHVEAGVTGLGACHLDWRGVINIGYEF